jgi:hypothetical protein
MREIRQSGSVGGELSLPPSNRFCHCAGIREDDEKDPAIGREGAFVLELRPKPRPLAPGRHRRRRHLPASARPAAMLR